MVIDLQAIPDELRSTPRWVVWRWVDREGRRTKPPFDPTTGRPGDATDPRLWMPLSRALEFLPRYDGVGFAVTLDSPYCGVDLDDCLSGGGGGPGHGAPTIAPWAEEIVRRLDSYTEVTPSGVGLRVWVRGKLPPGRRRKGGVELYDGGRYFTVTGRHLAGTPPTIEDRAHALGAVHAAMFPEPPRRRPPSPGPAPRLATDDEILERGFRGRNGDALAALMAGDTSAHGGDDSAADLALCSRLAFWFGGDPEAIDRVFRRSGLYREKWERADYRERTIAKALEGSGRAWTPPPSSPQPPSTPHPPSPIPQPPPVHRTDLGNAFRLVARHGEDLRYCHPWGRWLAWAGDRWQVDETGAVYRRAREVVRDLHREAADEQDEVLRKALAGWALSCESERRLNAMVSLGRQEPGIPVLPEQLDADPWVLNCPNGTLDLRNGRLGPHVRGDLLTKRTGVPFDPHADCPAWEAFLDRIMDGDAPLIGFLRRAVGYALVGVVTEHVLFFLYGRGRNGKSTFLNTILFALGDYAITVNADLLTSKGQDEHPTGVADLQGRRFVSTIEVEDGRRMAESLVKTLTGADRIRARRMRQDFYEFDPTHTLFLAANHKPTVRGTDEGIWRRIKLVPFRVQIPDDEVDRDLPARLRAEAPGVLAWAVRGCLEWQADGLAEPAAVAEATADYRAEMDVLADFLGDRCRVAPGLRARAGPLYRAYADWARETGNHQLSMNKFGRLLSERGFPPEKSNSTAWRMGLAMHDP